MEGSTPQLEVRPVALGDRAYFHARHLGERRSSVAPADKFRTSFAGDYHLHRAIGQVPNPPAKPPPTGFHLGRGPEPHTLHLSPDHQPLRHTALLEKGYPAFPPGSPRQRRGRAIVEPVGGGLSVEEEEDSSLVRRMAGGDRSAMGMLYDRQAPLLLGVSMKMGFDRETAEDLVHDIFLEVWRAAAEFDPLRGTVRTWLLVRLRSRALDRRRSGHARHVVAVADLQTVDRPLAMEEDPVLSSDRAAVVRGLDDLPPEQRHVLELAYFEGLSAAEIAGKVGIPTGTVKSRLASGLNKLRQALGRGP